MGIRQSQVLLVKLLSIKKHENVIIGSHHEFLLLKVKKESNSIKIENSNKDSHKKFIGRYCITKKYKTHWYSSNMLSTVIL